MVVSCVITITTYLAGSRGRETDSGGQRQFVVVEVTQTNRDLRDTVRFKDRLRVYDTTVVSYTADSLA